MASIGKTCKLGMDTRISFDYPMGRCINDQLVVCDMCAFVGCERRKLLKNREA